jgi:chromate transporter
MLIKLFFSFFKIGIFSFGGGYAALTVIQNEVVTNHGRISLAEFNNLITISQMTPGPIALNSATFVGTKIAGLAGGIVATLALISPSVIIVSTIAYFYIKYKNLDLMNNVLRLLRPAVISLIMIAALSIITTAIFDQGPIAIGSADFLIIGLIFFSFFLLYKKKMDPILTMLLSGLIYMLIHIFILS